MTIAEAVEFGEKTLSEINETQREVTSNVYILLSSLLKMSIPHLKFNSQIELTPNQIKTYQRWLERRLTFEPVQYITGETEFWSLPIMVGEGVLVPRQDTESLVSELKGYFNDINANYHFLDMGCGTGCIGISLLTIFPNSTVTFVDNYAKPIEYTKKNLERLNLSNRANVVMSDMFNGKILRQNTTLYDAIVSNPPYIPSYDLKSLSIQITLFEPLEALKAGESGLTFYEIFAAQAKKFLKPNAPLFLEIGYNQAEDVVKIFKDFAWQDPKIFMDMAGKPRVFFAKKN